MTGTKSWTIETVQYVWLLRNRGFSIEAIVDKIQERFPKFVQNFPGQFSETSVKYAAGQETKIDPHFKNVFSPEEMAFLFAVHDAMRHTGGLGDNRKAAFEEILQRFEWRFPNHEWAAPKGHVEAVRDILGSEWYRKYFENAPDGWTAEQVNFIVNCQRRKYSYGRTHMEYMQRWPGKQLYTYQIQYIIWESVFECYWDSRDWDGSTGDIRPAFGRGRKRGRVGVAPAQPAARRRRTATNDMASTMSQQPSHPNPDGHQYHLQSGMAQPQLQNPVGQPSHFNGGHFYPQDMNNPLGPGYPSQMLPPTNPSGHFYSQDVNNQVVSGYPSQMLPPTNPSGNSHYVHMQSGVVGLSSGNGFGQQQAYGLHGPSHTTTGLGWSTRNAFNEIDEASNAALAPNPEMPSTNFALNHQSAFDPKVSNGLFVQSTDGYLNSSGSHSYGGLTIQVPQPRRSVMLKFSPNEPLELTPPPEGPLQAQALAQAQLKYWGGIVTAQKQSQEQNVAAAAVVNEAEIADTILPSNEVKTAEEVGTEINNTYPVELPGLATGPAYETVSDHTTLEMGQFNGMAAAGDDHDFKTINPFDTVLQEHISPLDLNAQPAPSMPTNLLVYQPEGAQAREHDADDDQFNAWFLENSNVAWLSQGDVKWDPGYAEGV